MPWCVKWKGYSAEHDSWQTARDLRNAPEMLREWKKHVLEKEVRLARIERSE